MREIRFRAWDNSLKRMIDNITMVDFDNLADWEVMQSEKQAMSHLNPPYHHNAERLLLRHTKADNPMLGKVVGLQRSEQVTSLYGNLTTPMPKLVEAKDIFTNTALLCPIILVDHLKAMSLFITRMV